MTVDLETVAYRYHVHSEPVCGVGVKTIDVQAHNRAHADLQLLGAQVRFYEGHALQDGVAYEWAVRDRNGLLLISATTSSDGTTTYR